jgi:hypothetical protein
MKSRGFTMLWSQLLSRCHTIAVGVLVVATTSVGGFAFPQPAHAGASGDGSVSDNILTAEVRFDSPPTDSACVWEAVSGVQPITVTNGSVSHTETLVYQACDNRIVSYHWIRNDAPGRVAESVRSRVSRAINMLLVRTAPSATDMVVNSDMWFWVPRSLWKPIRLTAWVVTPVGPISVTVTARPHQLSYTPGDGNDTVRCVGPGRAWSARVRDTGESPCSYTYSSASHTRRSGTYSAQATITWNVSWTSNLGIGSPLPSVRTSLPITAHVKEVQVLLR